MMHDVAHWVKKLRQMLFDKIGCPIATLIFGGNGTPYIHIIVTYRERLTLRPTCACDILLDCFSRYCEGKMSPVVANGFVFGTVHYLSHIMFVDKYQNHGLDNIVIHMRGDWASWIEINLWIFFKLLVIYPYNTVLRYSLITLAITGQNMSVIDSIDRTAPSI